MKRSTLKQVIARSADEAGCAPEDKARLVATADSIDRVAVGAFVIKHPEVECGCPAAVAGYYVTDEFGGEHWAQDTPYAVKNFPGCFDPHFSTTAREGGRYRSKLTPDGLDMYVEVTD